MLCMPQVWPRLVQHLQSKHEETFIRRLAENDCAFLLYYQKCFKSAGSISGLLVVSVRFPPGVF